jgi:hypothetical protein
MRTSDSRNLVANGDDSYGMPVPLTIVRRNISVKALAARRFSVHADNGKRAERELGRGSVPAG